MTTNYYCDLETGTSTGDIALLLQSLMGGEISTDGGFLRVAKAPLYARIMTEPDPVVAGWFLEEWGLDGKITVGFILDESAPDHDIDAGHRTFSLASARLAEDLDVDAILRYEGNRLMMRRQNGALTLYDWWPDWTHPDVVAQLPPGYTLTDDGEGP